MPEIPPWLNVNPQQFGQLYGEGARLGQAAQVAQAEMAQRAQQMQMQQEQANKEHLLKQSSLAIEKAYRDQMMGLQQQQLAQQAKVQQAQLQQAQQQFAAKQEYQRRVAAGEPADKVMQELGPSLFTTGAGLGTAEWALRRPATGSSQMDPRQRLLASALIKERAEIEKQLENPATQVTGDTAKLTDRMIKIDQQLKDMNIDIEGAQAAPAGQAEIPSSVQQGQQRRVVKTEALQPPEQPAPAADSSAPGTWPQTPQGF